GPSRRHRDRHPRPRGQARSRVSRAQDPRHALYRRSVRDRRTNRDTEEPMQVIRFEGPIPRPANERSSASVSESMVSILDRWENEGAILRVPTGFAALDAACRGGFAIPSRVIVVGAPSAGKTALVMVLLQRFISAGVVCGVLGVDEEPDDLCIRF